MTNVFEGKNGKKEKKKTHLLGLYRSGILSAETQVRDGRVFHHDTEVLGAHLQRLPDVLGNTLPCFPRPHHSTKSIRQI